MSQENVEIARRWNALANAGDDDTVLNEIIDPEIECFPAEGEPEAEAFRGREAFRKRAYDVREVYEKHEIKVHEYIDLGDYVAVVASISARGRISGAEVSAEEVWLMRFKDGRCVEYRECGTREKAFEAAGLSE